MSRRTKLRQTEMVALWMPKPLAAALDIGVIKTDSDRSKFIRTALREKLAREGFSILELTPEIQPESLPA